MLDDLNTPAAIAHIHEVVAIMNRGTEDAERASLKAQLLACGHALGLLEQDPEAWFKWQPAGGAGLTDEEIDAQIAARVAAKKAKNYAEADLIRQGLLEQKIILEDGPTGTSWRRS